MHPIFFHKMAAAAAMPVVAVSGYAGYSHYQNQNQYQNQYPSTYQQNQNGNQYSQNQYGQLSVTGLDAPRQLTVGQMGAWSVHVSGVGTPSGGTLHYTVVWGDENTGVRSANAYYPSSSVNSSGTFSHVYIGAGSYTPVFTVTDSYGHSTQTSATVTVSASGSQNGNGGYTGHQGSGGQYGNQYRNQYGSQYGNQYNSGYGYNNYNSGASGSSYCNTQAGWNDPYCSTYNGGYQNSNSGYYNSGSQYSNTGTNCSYQNCTGYNNGQTNTNTTNTNTNTNTNSTTDTSSALPADAYLSAGAQNGLYTYCYYSRSTGAFLGHCSN